MISVVVSTYQPVHLAQLTQSIEHTIGVAYELITVDNSDGKKGLCEVYNVGARRATFDYLCFVHEDVQFVTPGWGKKVIEIFTTNPNIGLLGVAGSTYKPITPSHWSFQGANLDTFYVNIIQHYRYEPRTPDHLYINPGNVKLAAVAAIDGVWFCTTKKVFEEIPFDQHTFPGFHAYDVDYSLSIKQHYDVAVTLEILMEHLSEGRFSKEWIEAVLALHKKWRRSLPVSLVNYDRPLQELEEKKAFILFTKWMANNKYSFLQMLGLFRFQNKRFRFSVRSQASLFLRMIKYKFTDVSTPLK